MRSTWRGHGHDRLRPGLRQEPWGNRLPTEVFLSLADRGRRLGWMPPASSPSWASTWPPPGGRRPQRSGGGWDPRLHRGGQGGDPEGDAVALIAGGKVQLVVNTPAGRGSRADGIHIRATRCCTRYCPDQWPRPGAPPPGSPTGPSTRRRCACCRSTWPGERRAGGVCRVDRSGVWPGDSASGVWPGDSASGAWPGGVCGPVIEPTRVVRSTSVPGNGPPRPPGPVTPLTGQAHSPVHPTRRPVHPTRRVTRPNPTHRVTRPNPTHRSTRPNATRSPPALTPRSTRARLTRPGTPAASAPTADA